MDAAQITFRQNGNLRYAFTPNWEARVSAGPAGALPRQAFAPTRADALKWTEEGITRIQYEEDEEHMGHLRGSIACVPRAKSKWPEVYAARRDEVN